MLLRGGEHAETRRRTSRAASASTSLAARAVALAITWTMTIVVQFQAATALIMGGTQHQSYSAKADVPAAQAESQSADPEATAGAVEDPGRRVGAEDEQDCARTGAAAKVRLPIGSNPHKTPADEQPSAGEQTPTTDGSSEHQASSTSTSSRADGEHKDTA